MPLSIGYNYVPSIHNMFIARTAYLGQLVIRHLAGSLYLAEPMDEFHLRFLSNTVCVGRYPGDDNRVERGIR